jgi:glycosyltransferase involved in cell wall biosynthesis
MQSAILRLKLTKPDVMHGFGAYPVSLVATQLARKYNCKSITTFIGSDVNEFPVRNKKSMKLFLDTIENSHHVLTVSKALAKRVFDLGGKMAEVVHMPIRGLKELDFSRDVFRKDLGIGTNQFVVLFAGSISLSKGVKELCEALNMLSDEPNIMALFAGPEGDAISILKQQKNARWMGNLSHDELMKVMHASDVLVLPSKMEGIPGVIKEAGQCMLPVVASNVGGIPEVVNDSNGYLIEKVDAQNIYNAILHVYKNIYWAKERAARMKSYIMEEFDGDNIAQRLLYIYSKDIQTNN